jgi:6-phosphogluconolactonase
MFFMSRSFPDLDSLSQAAAEYIVDAANKAILEKDLFTLVLSGGKTPLTLYRMLASPLWNNRIPWGKTNIFWSDERCVPIESDENNYRSAYETFLSHVPIPEKNIHRIQAEKGGIEAAFLYQKELEKYFLLQKVKTDYFPRFDCLLLGMGYDGHIASLFPETDELNENERWVVPSTAPSTFYPRERVTLTLPVINHSERVLLLLSGMEKKNILLEEFDYFVHGIILPVSRVKPRGECMMYMDFPQ